MFARTHVLRAVATTDVAAGHADAQMHPAVAGLQAILATLRAGRDFPDLLQMFALERHNLTPARHATAARIYASGSA